jgi:arsenite transporter
MGAGLALGSIVPSLNERLAKLQVGTVSLPIAPGLLIMMYPVLAKVRYEDLGRMRVDGVSNHAFFAVSLFLSWIVGPLIEVPVLLTLVYVALWLAKRLLWREPAPVG